MVGEGVEYYLYVFHGFLRFESTRDCFVCYRTRAEARWGFRGGEQQSSDRHLMLVHGLVDTLHLVKHDTRGAVTRVFY